MIDDFQRPPARKPTRLDSYGQPLGNAASPRSMQNLSPDISPRPAQTSQTYSASMPLTAAQPFSADRLYEPVDQDVVLPDNSDKKRRFAFKKPTRKQAILLGVGFIILIGSGAAYALTRPDPEPAPKPVVAKVVPKP
ncbi:MAG TPA: hypothetical protein VK983_00680, partial [Candidatus Limnocylindrales bacterium]|nr:hypothetical protein [Candidatus Limnocylindrales bacterium]